MSDTNPRKPSLTPPLADGCPQWAAELVEQISVLEVRLGNIQASTPWTEANLKELSERLDRRTTTFDEAAVEALFREVCCRLTEEGYPPAKIASFVNARIPSGRLPYCNSDEVEEAIAAGATDDN